jgi:hypothetical protein
VTIHFCSSNWKSDKGVLISIWQSVVLLVKLVKAVHDSESQTPSGEAESRWALSELQRLTSQQQKSISRY